MATDINFIDLPVDVWTSIAAQLARHPRSLLHLSLTCRALHCAVWLDDSVWQVLVHRAYPGHDYGPVLRSASTSDTPEPWFMAYKQLHSGFEFATADRAILLGEPKVNEDWNLSNFAVSADRKSVRLAETYRTWSNIALLPCLRGVHARGTRSVTLVFERMDDGGAPVAVENVDDHYVNLGIGTRIPPKGNAPGFVPGTWGVMSARSGYSHLYFGSKACAGSVGFAPHLPVTMQLDCDSGLLSVLQEGAVIGQTNIPLELIRNEGVYLMACLSTRWDVARIVASR